MKKLITNIKVNAGGSGVKGKIKIPFSESLMEGATLLGGGSNIPNLVRHAIATSAPALTVL